MEAELLQLFLHRKIQGYVELYKHGIFVPDENTKSVASLIAGVMWPRNSSAVAQKEKNTRAQNWLQGRRKLRGGIYIRPPEGMFEVIKATCRCSEDFDMSWEHILTTFVESLLARESEESGVSVLPEDILFIPESEINDVTHKYHSWLCHHYALSTEEGMEVRGKVSSLFQDDVYILRDDSYVRGRSLRTYGEVAGLCLLTQCPETILEDASFLLWEREGFRSVNGFSRRLENGIYEGYAKLWGKEVRIDPHAFLQFKARSRTGNKKDKIRLLEFLALLQGSTEVQRPNNFYQLLRHGGREAVYRSAKGWIFVIELHTGVKTCYYKGNITAHGYEYITSNTEIHP